MSEIKLRQAGFGASIDTEAMVAKWLSRVCEPGVISSFGVMRS
jgi:hypothetical protein